VSNVAEIIARRTTSDGKIVTLWSDGDLTFALGRGIPGLRFPRSALGLRAGWLVMGEVELYDASEVALLAKAALGSAKRGELPGELRARIFRSKSQEAAAEIGRGGKALVSLGLAPKRMGLVPKWMTLETDRNGKPTLRVWKLPRLIYGGLAVWHERGTFEIMREAPPHSGTYVTTGFERKTLREVVALLPELRERMTADLSSQDAALKAKVKALVGKGK
jgi:hypothetical protein